MTRVAIDTNLLLLLIVGLTSRSFIERHKRTKIYTSEDFDLLMATVARASGLVVTPHVLAETSNLARQFSEPGKGEIGAVMRSVIDRSEELFDRAAAVAAHPTYIRLGLTDAGLVRVQSESVVLLTDDLDLYLASVAQGHAAINFSHLRDRRPA